MAVVGSYLLRFQVEVVSSGKMAYVKKHHHQESYRTEKTLGVVIFISACTLPTQVGQNPVEIEVFQLMICSQVLPSELKKDSTLSPLASWSAPKPTPVHLSP